MWPNSTARRGPSGFTLLEVLVVLALTALAGGLFLQILVPTFRNTARASARAGLGQEAMLVLERLERDLRECAAPTVFRFEEADGTRWLYFQKLVSVDTGRTQRWSAQAPPFPGVVYRWLPPAVAAAQGGGAAVFSRVAGVNLVDQGPVGLDDPTLDQVKTGRTTALSAGGQDADLAPHLQGLEWTEDRTKGTFTVRLTMARDDLQGAPLSLTLERILVPRNTLRTSNR